jgi:hypothetical protein
MRRLGRLCQTFATPLTRLPRTNIVLVVALIFVTLFSTYIQADKTYQYISKKDMKLVLVLLLQKTHGEAESGLCS